MAGRLQISEHLCGVNGFKRCDRLELEHHAAVDDHVQPVLVHNTPFVENGHWNLTFERKLTKSELDRHRFLVGRFEKSGPERAMHFDRCTNDSEAEVV